MELEFEGVGFVEADKPEELTKDDFISEVKSNGFNPIDGTLTEDDNLFWVFCEGGCWLRGEK